MACLILYACMILFYFFQFVIFFMYWNLRWNCWEIEGGGCAGCFFSEKTDGC
jgi:heme O synthase-like polyprenyltransferase